jgi:hypothetical protein
MLKASPEAAAATAAGHTGAGSEQLSREVPVTKKEYLKEKEL